jgi:hypothetical protein
MPNVKNRTAIASGAMPRTTPCRVSAIPYLAFRPFFLEETGLAARISIYYDSGKGVQRFTLFAPRHGVPSSTAVAADFP